MLRVEDDGVGMSHVVEGAGIRGMRERALLIDAELSVTSRLHGGTTVSLLIPMGETRGRRERQPTRILLADDHALVRRGVRMILDAEPDLTVVAEAADGAEAWPSRRARPSTSRSSMSRCPG